MASINTNVAAMTALQTLTATNKNLATTQDRIATGLRVGQASDNAAYWSIATTMRSDNKAMSTVQEALGLGAAQVDVAYTAMDAVKDTLDTMKSKLVAASQPDVDKAKIQEEISQLQNDLKTYAKSASFSGGNWLDVDSNATQKVVASFIRDSGGNVSLETIDINTAKFALFNETQGGLLEGSISVTPGAEEIDVSGLSIGASTVADGTEAATATVVGFSDLEFEANDTFSFSLKLGGSATSVQFTATIDSPADPVAGINAALLEVYGTAQVVASLDGDGNLVFTTDEDDAGFTIEVSNLSAATAGDDPVDVNMANFNITELGRGDIQALLSQVDSVLGKVTTAASDLGAIKTRIDNQQTFVGKIMDAVDRGVGQLVDADMQQESARLSALQVQQQLGIQALSIANANSQNILSLFR